MVNEHQPETAKITRSKWYLVVLGIVLLGTLFSFGVLGTGTAGKASAHAASCRNLGVYTDYYYNNQHNPPNAPAIYIWNGAVRPDPSKITILYYGWWQETVPSPSDWGVRTDAPQVENRNGWYIYYIAGRWYDNPINQHWTWNDDWRWTVRYCG